MFILQDQTETITPVVAETNAKRINRLKTEFRKNFWLAEGLGHSIGTTSSVSGLEFRYKETQNLPVSFVAKLYNGSLSFPAILKMRIDLKAQQVSLETAAKKFQFLEVIHKLENVQPGEKLNFQIKSDYVGLVEIIVTRGAQWLKLWYEVIESEHRLTAHYLCKESNDTYEGLVL